MPADPILLTQMSWYRVDEQSEEKIVFYRNIPLSKT